MSEYSLPQTTDNFTCYILGAGFSCGAGLPLSNNFLEKMDEVHAQYYLGITPPSLNVPMDELFRFRNKRSEFFDQYMSNNVEFWLSLVSARTLGNVASRGFNKYMMQIAIAQTIAHYVQNSKNITFIDQFITLVKQSEKRAIITLNYDDLIERSCERVEIPYTYGINYRGLNHIFKIDLLNYKGKMLVDNEVQSSIPIYKLHGSYNWIAEQENILFISDMQNFFLNKAEFWAGNEWIKYRFLIEPPTIDKMYAGRALSVIWGKAYDSLISALHIIIIGYSFPENDGYVKYLLMASLVDNAALKQVTIVDPSCDGSYKDRIKWLLELLVAKKVRIIFCQQNAEDWIHSQILGLHHN